MKLTKMQKLTMAFISLLISIFLIQDTYAKYLTSANGVTDIAIARWKIIVNNYDIRNGSNISNVVTPVFDANDNIATSVIAPTSTGYFDLIIDSTNTDVSFSYKITTTINSDSSVKDLVTTGYSLNEGPITPLTLGQGINGSILYSNPSKVNKVRVYIKWDDSATSTMDNEQDTVAAESGKAAKLDVNLNFIQTTN